MTSSAPSDPLSEADLPDRLDAALARLWHGENASFDDLVSTPDAAAPDVRDLFGGLIGLPAAPLVRPGEQVDQYTIIRELGRGGMGVVFEAEQHQPRRRVALKLIRSDATEPADSYRVRLFQREVTTLARLRHPRIATIYDAGRTPAGQHFFVMELVSGAPLLDFASGRTQPTARPPLGIRDRLELCATICDAIHYAHQRGVIHRDLKPGNILVDDAGRPKVLDFGLARIIDADTPSSVLLTQVGRVVGTLAYMSPEQARGQMDEVDARSDIYALGLILYELLVGRLPYDLSRGAPLEAARIICETPPTRLSTFNSALRGDLETIVHKALAKEPEQRYPSAAALAEDLRRFLTDEPILARPPSAAYQLRMFARRNRGLVTSALISVVVLIAATAVSAWLAVRARTAEVLAEERLVQAESVGDFLTQMLSHVDPSLAQGSDVTVLRNILDDAAQRLQTELAEHPLVRADLHETIGTVYRNLSLYEQAEPHLLTAHDLRLDLLGADDPLTLTALDALAELRWKQDRTDDALTLYDDLVARRAATVGEFHRNTLSARHSRAGVLNDLGRVAEAEAELRAVLAVMDDRLPADDPVRLDALNALAVLLYEHEQFEEAEKLQRAVLDQWTALYGPRHPTRLRALRNLAVVVRQRGDLPAAEELAREVLALHEDVFGARHHATIEARINLASILRDAAQLEESEGLARTAYEQARIVLGPTHDVTLKAVSHLGVVYRLLKRWDDAEHFLHESVTLSEQLYGADEPRTLNRLSSLAGLLYEQGKLTDAETIMRRVVAGMRTAYGENHSQTLTTMNNLGLLLVELDKLDEAAELLQESIRLVDAAAPPGHPYRCVFRVSYAQCLTRQQRFEEAEALLLDCHTQLSEKLGPQHYHTQAAAMRLSELYDAWGRPADAARYRDDAAPTSAPAP